MAIKYLVRTQEKGQMHYFDASKPRSRQFTYSQLNQPAGKPAFDSSYGMPSFSQVKSTRYDSSKETALYKETRASKLGHLSDTYTGYRYAHQGSGFDSRGQTLEKPSFAPNYLYKDLTDTQEGNSNSRTNFNDDTQKKGFINRTATASATDGQYFNENMCLEYVSKSTAYSPKGHGGVRALKSLAESIAKSQPLKEIPGENSFFKINKDKRAKVDENHEAQVRQPFAALTSSLI
jgi:hypothetical protein